MTDYTKLRELATKATPGPWTVQNGAIIRHFYPLPVAAVIADVSDPAHPSAKADAEYIAAASPDGVIALLDEIERLRSLWDTDPTAAAFRARDEAIDAGRIAVARLAAVSAARDEACDKLESWVSALPPNLQAIGEIDIARMRKVGK